MGSERAKTQTGGREASTGFIPGDYSLAVGMPSTPAPSGWKWTKLSDLARLESGHTPSRKFPEYWNGDVCWIGIRDATANHGQTIYDTNQHVTELGIQNSSARMLPTNTVCLSRTASVGYVIVMGKEMATSQDFVNWVCSEELNHQFLKYILLSENRSFLRFASGTTHQTIYFPEVKAFHICHPPLPEQKAIAHILGTLDDKIELNRRMNATLEGMAQALFKSWFVDFDPVIDNALAAGNPIPDELAPRAEVRKKALASGNTQQGSVDHPTLSDPKSLFPATFQFTEELGPIPKGWNTRKLSELATVTKGKSYKSSELQSSTTALVTLKSFIRGGGYRLDGLKEYTGTYKPEQVVESGDLIISYTDVTQAADVIGKPAMVIPDERYETLVISLDVGVVRPSEPTLKHFLYQLARTKRFEDWMLSHTSGTTVLHLSKNAFPSFECAFPDEELISEFEKIVSPLFERTVQNVKESRALTKLRDTLLPKLISGKLTIKY